MDKEQRLNNLIDILHKGNHSLVIYNGETTSFDERGVTDLFMLINTRPSFLQGAYVADKVVGKGAAALMILGGVHAVYADVISRPALELFNGSSVSVSYGREVENIINRMGNDICPVETLCIPCLTAEECLPLITKFINQIKNK